MEAINQSEIGRRDRTEKSIIIKNIESFDDKVKEDMQGFHEMSANKTSILQDYDKNGSINITDLLDENESLRQKYKQISLLKQKLKTRKKESKYLSNETSIYNTKYFVLAKIFTEGMHEVSKELLKIHEIQLDKIISKNNSDNSMLYFELHKDRQFSSYNGAYNNEDQLKLPKISSNIQKKYNYPVVEKSDPTVFIYNAIKHMLEENQTLNKTLNFRNKRINWEEFKNLSAYQIYTILTLHKDLTKNLESKIYPRSFI
jgi:hypothetical protein